jgi:predicted NAD/FAD-binding protein
MRIAIVGSGISGLVCAHLLYPDHEITVFEAQDHPGGHTHTHDLEQGGRRYAVDTGFIVFNEVTYPGLVKLFQRLGVESQPSTMSFGVRNERTGLEWNGSSLDQIFAQRRNVVNPSFLRMIRDLLRFRREARELLAGDGPGPTLGGYLEDRGYSRAFAEDCLLPMGAAIWSADPACMREFPARRFVRFFENHRFLEARQPRWRVVKGGSRRYVEALTAPFRDRIRLRTPVQAVRRYSDRVEVTPAGGPSERFDQVIVATHSDQALRLLADPTPAEREILAAIPYQQNAVVLHTDDSVLPRSPRARGGWNVLVPRRERGRVSVTYDMNRLQGLDARPGFRVSLNLEEAIDPARVLRRLDYQHPVFTTAGDAAQRRRGEILGAQRTWFVGAYWGQGFHEDGLQSALAVCRRFGKEL